MRDKKLERQAPLPTRTMRRDGRLIFFFLSFLLPCSLQTFFSRWIHIQSLSFWLLFRSVVSALPGFIPSFLLHGQLHQRPHSFPIFGLLISLSNCPPLISNPSLSLLGRDWQRPKRTRRRYSHREKRLCARLVHHPPRQRPPLDKIAYSVLTSDVELHSPSFSYTLRASPLRASFKANHFFAWRFFDRLHNPFFARREKSSVCATITQTNNHFKG